MKVSLVSDTCPTRSKRDGVALPMGERHDTFDGESHDGVARHPTARPLDRFWGVNTPGTRANTSAARRTEAG